MPANAGRLKLGSEISDDLCVHLADAHGSEARLNVGHQHPLIALERPIGEIRNGVLSPPLFGEVLHRAISLLEEPQLA